MRLGINTGQKNDLLDLIQSRRLERPPNKSFSCATSTDRVSPRLSPWQQVHVIRQQRLRFGRHRHMRRHSYTRTQRKHTTPINAFCRPPPNPLPLFIAMQLRWGASGAPIQGCQCLLSLPLAPPYTRYCLPQVVQFLHLLWCRFVLHISSDPRLSAVWELQLWPIPARGRFSFHRTHFAIRVAKWRSFTFTSRQDEWGKTPQFPGIKIYIYNVYALHLRYVIWIKRAAVHTQMVNESARCALARCSVRF